MTQPTLFNKGTAPKRVSFKRAVSNIETVLTAAHPLEVSLGNDWYARAHRVARDIARTHKIPTRAACHIIAALSPNSRWERNVKDSYHLCAELAQGKAGDTIRVSTYGKNRDKAVAIFRAASRGEQYQGILSGQKVTSFALNIEHPNREIGVTVDFHAHSIAINWRLRVHESKITTRDYAVLTRAYSDVAARHGLKPHQAQAITWVAWKRIHKV